MLVESRDSWIANAAKSAGAFIEDSNGNLQEATGSQQATITNIQIISYTVGGSPGRLVTLFLSPSTPLNIAAGVQVTLTGLTHVPALNGANYPVSVIQNSIQIQIQVAGTSLPITAYATETGTASTGTGISGAIPPSWTTGITSDGGQQWVYKGPAVMDWGFSSPLTAPTVTQVAAPTIFPLWSASTWYAPLFVLLDSNGNLQQLTTSGTTGSAAPTWNVTVGGNTTDGTAVWTNLGSSAWQANHAYAVGSVVLTTYTYWITTYDTEMVYNGYTYEQQVVATQSQVTAQGLFQCTQAGTSGANPPSWVNGLSTLTSDNSVVWKNLSTPITWSTIGATQAVSTTTSILDSNGFQQQIQTLGKSGTAAPTWAAQGVETVETGSATPAIWLNVGPYSSSGATAASPWIYAYSGKSSITRHVSTASPLSLPIALTKGNQVVIQGLGVPFPPEDRIVIWRTLAGGSTLFQLDEIPNPGLNQTWTYTDTTPDLPGGGSPGLNQQIIAAIAGANDPPPSNFVPQCYYLTRVWGFTGNILRYSAGPDQAGTSGAADQSFPSQNNFQLPSLGVKCWPTSVGLIVYTNSDIFLVLGQGTDASPFYVTTFQEGVGLAAQDAFCVNGSTAYGMLTSGQVVSMDPGAGEVEVGFPIGDLFNSQYTPSETYCAWHQGSSADMALYVADGSTGWYRMAAVAAPEQGNVWSTQAQIVGGVKAIASVEIAPGVKGLLLGPAQQNQPILMRDKSTNQDNGNSYPAFSNIGVITMAQPGSTAGVEFIVTEETFIPGASPVKVGILCDEIAGPYIYLRNTTTDPPNLPPSRTIKAQRFWTAQDANTILPTRYFQQQIQWAAENFPNELLTNTLFGRLPEKVRR